MTASVDQKCPVRTAGEHDRFSRGARGGGVAARIDCPHPHDRCDDADDTADEEYPCTPREWAVFVLPEDFGLSSPWSVGTSRL